MPLHPPYPHPSPAWPLDNKFDPLLKEPPTASGPVQTVLYSQQNSVGVEQSAPLFISSEIFPNVSGWSCGCAHKEEKARIYICMRKLTGVGVVVVGGSAGGVVCLDCRYYRFIARGKQVL